jgi:hypothetical protein
MGQNPTPSAESALFAISNFGHSEDLQPEILENLHLSEFVTFHSNDKKLEISGNVLKSDKDIVVLLCDTGIFSILREKGYFTEPMTYPAARLAMQKRQKAEMGTKTKKMPKKKNPAADSIANTINIPLKESECITGKEITEIFRSAHLPENNVKHIRSLFAEIRPARLVRFFAEENISFKQAQKIYEAFPHQCNTLMEAFLYGHMGKTS